LQRIFFGQKHARKFLPLTIPVSLRGNIKIHAGNTLNY